MREVEVPGRRDERGAVAVVLALAICFVMLPLAAYTVDIGMQRVLRRDMQALADVVALDAVRGLDGRSKQAILADDGHWRDPIARSVESNLNLALSQVPHPDAPQVGVSAAAGADAVATVDGSPLAVQVSMGGLDETGAFVPVSEEEVPTAVQVVARSSLKHAFSGGSGGAVRSAVASVSQSACFRIGTLALGLSTDASVLNGLLGNALRTGVLGYAGLSTSTVGLGDLAAELGAGTPAELVTMPGLTLGRLLEASAQVLDEHDPGHANVGLLRTIRTKVIAAGLAGTVIDLGEILDVGTANASGLDASLNVLDLVSTMAFLANGDAAIAVPGLALNVPNVTDLGLELRVIQPPRIACNDGVATTGQVELRLSGDLSAGVPLVLTVSGPITLELGLAEATGRLASVGQCVDGSPASITVAVSDQRLASTRLSLGDPDGSPPSWVKVQALGILGPLGPTIPLLNAGVATNQPSVAESYTLDPWTSYVTTPYRTPQTPRVLPNFSASVGLVGIPLGALLSPLVNNVLTPLVGVLNTLVTGTIAPALGLRLAGVDLYALGDPGPTCLTPRLVG